MITNDIKPVSTGFFIVLLIVYILFHRESALSA